MSQTENGQLPNTSRSARPALVAIATVVPVSLLALYLWSTEASTLSSGGLDASAGAALATPGAFLGAWMLMIMGMMLPSAMPLLVSLDRISRKLPSRHEIPVLAALTYLGVWGLVGIVLYETSFAADAYILPHLNPANASRLAGGGVVLVGLYGLSPLAGACLRACRQPFGFLAQYWRGDSNPRLQAARIGVAYGVSCVGCCIPMLGVMFVVGMANIAIVIALGVLMVIMKTSSFGTRVARVLSIALIGAGIAVVFGWLPLLPHHH